MAWNLLIKTINSTIKRKKIHEPIKFFYQTLDKTVYNKLLEVD